MKKNELKPKRLVDKKLLQEIKTWACVICRRPPPSDPAHVKSVGSGGPDTLWNTLPLCRYHHSRQHAMGWGKIFEENPIFWYWMQAIGWYWIKDFNGIDTKLWNDKLNNKFSSGL